MGVLGYLMGNNGDMKALREVLHSVEMFRREVRMRNKVELYKALLVADDGEMDWEELAEVANQVYAEMYVLRRARNRDDHGDEDRRSTGQ